MWNRDPYAESRPHDEVDAMLALSLVPGIGPGRIRAMLAYFGTAMNVFRAAPSGFRIHGVGDMTVRGIREFTAWDEVDHQRARAGDVEAALVMAGSEYYSDLLAEIFDPPPFLWVRGDQTILNQPAVSIVGTRRASEDGKRRAFELGRDLASAGLVIVSGLAYGIDGQAHRGALEAGGRTVAVLGSGVGVIYPSGHQRLAHEILERGALVSEFSPGAKPEASHFPRRNRVVSGLTLGTIVVEARAPGGALITARFALEQNRDVFAVPASLERGAPSATNRMIRDGHARLIESADDVLLDLGLAPVATTATEKRSTPDLGGLEKTLFDALGPEPMHIDRLCHATDLDSSTALVHLLNLEFKGVVRQMAGKQFFRA